MQFVHQALTWGFLLALVPLLIHLINLLRRRRVQWAAMDFLLRSYKKHRKWIWLKQLLLLLTRMAVIGLVVMMLAQWITRKQWLSIFGATATHHFVLLDDSYSMSEREGGTSAFERAKRVLGDLAAQSMGQDSQQKFTLIRYSRAAAAGAAVGADFDATQAVDMNAEIVDGDFDVLMEEQRRGLEPTQLAVGPQAALAVLNELLDQGRDDNNLVYVLSDFREKEWASPNEFRTMLRETEKLAAETHFIHCVNQVQPNLTLTEIKPETGTRAAGVPLFVLVSVRNHGDSVARKVQVKIRTLFYDPDALASSDPGKLTPQADEPPTLLIDEIAAGETATRRVQVFFPKPGAQVVEATLADDAVATDNRRWCVVDVADGEPVLLVDGSLEQKHAYFLQSAFQPGQRANTGIRPDLQPVSFLRDVTPEALAKYAAIYLLDVDRLDDRAVENVEQYLRQGGGVGVFVGENVNRAFYTERLYRGGEGFFPLPLDRDELLADALVEETPDFEVENHPVFSIFLGERNPFVRLVSVERYLKPPPEWRPGPDAPTEILAKLRTGDPLAVEQRFGEGRVIAFLTTAAPLWNNWGHDPSFVVAMLKLQAYLSSAGLRDDTRLVGTPLNLTLAAKEYLAKVAFVTPAAAAGSAPVVELNATGSTPESELLTASLHRSIAVGGGQGTEASGVYEAWLQLRDGRYDVHRYALNADATEGDLAVPTSQALLSRLEPLTIKYRQADDYGFDLIQQAGYNRSLAVMALLIVLLLGEQLLAYASSYHPARGAA